MRRALTLLPIFACAILLVGVSFYDNHVSVAAPAAAATPVASPVPAATPIVTPAPTGAPEDPAAIVSAPSAPTPTPTPVVTPTPIPHEADPIRLRIPSIGLNDPIVPVGLNSIGQMAVPNGNTNNVGWYEDGTVPGEEGSAVLDAHVFAAFAKLNSLNVGDDIYVTTADGTMLHFRVYETDTYADADVPLERLFNQDGGEYLNLITCAGKLTPDRSTYDHRFVAYAELMNG